MDKIIILIPLIVSAAMLSSREPKDVFVLVFFPALTILPAYFNAELVPGTPELYFWSAALIPILMAWAIRNFEGYQFHKLDMIVFSYVLIIFFSQWSNSDYKQSQKLLFNNLMSVCFPYLLVRSFGEDRDTLIRMIKIITFLGAFIAFINVYEFRMSYNFFDRILRDIWPHHVSFVGVLRRYGFNRTSGPFSHPILCGYFFSLAVPLSIWCYAQNYFENKNIGRAIVLLNITGIFTALSRAPMIGFFIAMGIIYYGWSNKKAAIGSVMSIVIIILFMVGMPKFLEYVSVTRATAKTDDQRNVAYRKEMWEEYINLVIEKPFLGWGKFTVPKLKNLGSIDSEYLNIALMHGVGALFSYLGLAFYMIIKLLLYVRNKPPDDPWVRLSWCMIAVWCSSLFTLATVYSGNQAVQYFFILCGLGQVVLLSSEKWVKVEEKTVEIKYIGRGFGFARVV